MNVTVGPRDRLNEEGKKQNKERGSTALPEAMAINAMHPIKDALLSKSARATQTSKDVRGGFQCRAVFSIPFDKIKIKRRRRRNMASTTRA